LSAEAASATAQQTSSAATGGWWRGVLLVAAALALFLVVAAIGAGEAARGTRVLPFLDPVLDLFRTGGRQSILWLTAHGALIGWAVTGTALAISAAAFALGGRRAAPVGLLAVAVSLATWGQVVLLADRTQLGAWLYGLGVLCASLLGIWCPMTRLNGFPRLPRPTDRDPRGADAAAAERRAHAGLPRRWASWEYALVLLFILVALLIHTYQLTELTQSFDLEMVDTMIMSRTLHGIREYLQYVFWANNNGIFHILTERVLFPLFGTSIYTVRLTAVFWGTAAVPLMYWLGRRMAGVSAAIVSTLFLLVGPEQLFWSRTENSFFAPVAVLALVTAHVGLWLVERLSFRAACAAALCMPMSRYVYTPSMAMFVYPVVLYGHAVVFVRGAWRKAWYVVPVLAAGVVLWIYSLSLLTAYGNGWKWQFINPANVHGGNVWTYHGEFQNAGVVELVRLQAGVILNNLGHVLRGAAYDGQGMFSHWYVRGFATADHVTSMNPGMAVIVALGLGYLLSQIYERRAFALLVWVGLGLLPGVMSDEPSPRRTALIFAALYAIAGIMVVASGRIVRARAGPRLAWVTSGALGVAIAGIAWSSLVCHFLIGSGPVLFGDHIRFTRRIFEHSDAIVHNLEIGGLERAVVLGNLDSFVRRLPCYQHVDAGDWLGAALRARCDFSDHVYPLVVPPQRVEELRRTYNPRRITFLMEETPYSRQHIDLLRRLYPAAQIERHQSSIDQKKLVALTVDCSDVDALHTPSLIVSGDAPELATTLLAGVQLKEERRAPDAGTAETPSIVVRGGLLLERPGWYQFQFEPACAVATFTVDQRAPSADLQPMLAGVHPFEITVPSASACPLPLQLHMRSDHDPTLAPVDPTLFVSPSAASLPELQARPAIPYPGYGEPQTLILLKEAAMDLGVDAHGNLAVLASDHNPVHLQWFGADGVEQRSWALELPIRGHLASMIVDPDGKATLLSETTVVRYDPYGTRLGSWQTPWPEWSSEIVRWHDGRIILVVPDRDAIAIFTPDGRLQREMKSFDGGPQFRKPMSLTLGPENDVLVIQDDGTAHLFHVPGDDFAPVFQRSFHVDFARVPLWSHGCAFDGPDRILVPDLSSNRSLVYNRAGERMMAGQPERDLGSRDLGPVLRFLPTTDHLYALDRAGRVWSLAR
jgi:hypothetical protein